MRNIKLYEKHFDTIEPDPNKPNMLPLSLLNATQGHPMLIELKNGETYNGHLVNCDGFMNINLKEVICTSPDGTSFWRLPEVHLRGNSIKYLRIPDDVLDIVKEDRQYKKSGGKGFNRKKK